MRKAILSLALVLITFSVVFADGYEVGDKARDFNLLNIDGEYLSLADYRDTEGFIVIFTCNHCPYAKLYEERIIAIDKKYKEEGFPVIAINPNDSIRQPQDSFSKMIARADEKGFTFPYLLDADQSIAKAYGATRTPHVYLLEKVDADYVVRYIGAIDDNSKDESAVEEKFLEDAINDVKNGERPDPDFTKAIGCTIKWAE
jgi:peroxiredoxin